MPNVYVCLKAHVMYWPQIGKVGVVVVVIVAAVVVVANPAVVTDSPVAELVVLRDDCIKNGVMELSEVAVLGVAVIFFIAVELVFDANLVTANRVAFTTVVDVTGFVAEVVVAVINVAVVLA